MGGYTQLNDEINLDVDVSELSSKLSPILSGIAEMNLSLLRRCIRDLWINHFILLGVECTDTVFVPSPTWYLYAARRKSED